MSEEDKVCDNCKYYDSLEYYQHMLGFCDVKQWAKKYFLDTCDRWVEANKENK